MLTGGLIPEDPVIKLIEGLSEVVPIVSVTGGTFAIANKIGSIRPKIYAENKQKIEVSIHDFTRLVPINALAERLITFEASGITPRMFQYNLLKRAQSIKKHIVLPEGTDERVLKAAKELINADAVKLTLLGNPLQIKEKARQLDLLIDFEKISIIDPVEFRIF